MASQESAPKPSINYTDSIIAAIQDEMRSEPGMPTIFVGDVNAEPNMLSSIKDLSEEESCTDLGANASFWAGKDDETTCQSSANAKASRIDGTVAKP